MIDSPLSTDNIFYRRISNGNYLYFKMGILSKNAVVISREDKAALQKINNKAVSDFLKRLLIAPIIAAFYPYLALLAIALLGFWTVADMCVSRRKIFQGKEIQYVSDWTIWFVLNLYAKNCSWSYLLKLTGLAIILTIYDMYDFHYDVHSSNFMDHFVFWIVHPLMILASLLFIAITLIKLYAARSSDCKK